MTLQSILWKYKNLRIPIKVLCISGTESKLTYIYIQLTTQNSGRVLVFSTAPAQKDQYSLNLQLV